MSPHPRARLQWRLAPSPTRGEGEPRHPPGPLARLLLLAGLSAVLVGVAAWVAASLAIWQAALGRVYDVPEAVPPRPVALVFGAGLRADGSPSRALRNRVEAAAELYHAGKVAKLLMTGDNTSADYDEVGAMRRAALGLGVPPEAIALDRAGLRTYDSCYRARAVFGIDQAVVVTQPFHLPRTIYTCEHLGVASVGYAAEEFGFGADLLARLREQPAILLAWLEVNLLRPTPRVLDPLDTG